jgi:hypothetical protein
MRLPAIFAAALLLAACPGNQPEDESHAGPAQTSTSASNPQAVPENSTAMNPVLPPQKDLPGSRPAAAGPITTVQLTEYAINLPDAVPPGPMTLQIVNSGKEDHNFAIEGNGVSQKLAADLPRGDTTTLTLDLKPGTYRVWCPVDGHRGKGMERTLVVH